MRHIQNIILFHMPKIIKILFFIYEFNEITENRIK